MASTALYNGPDQQATQALSLPWVSDNTGADHNVHNALGWLMWCVGAAAGMAGLDYPADCLCSVLHLSRGQRRAESAPRGERCGLSPIARYTGKTLSRATGLGCMFILGRFAANQLLLCAYSQQFLRRSPGGANCLTSYSGCVFYFSFSILLVAIL